MNVKNALNWNVQEDVYMVPFLVFLIIMKMFTNLRRHLNCSLGFSSNQLCSLDYLSLFSLNKMGLWSTRIITFLNSYVLHVLKLKCQPIIVENLSLIWPT